MTGFSFRYVLAAAVVAFGAISAAPAPSPAAGPPALTPIVRDAVHIPMRDGVELVGTVYLPDDKPGTWPVIVSITPYDRNGGHRRALMFARAGFAFLAVDVRGRGDSGGVYTPLEETANDTYDTIEWAAKQPYANGKVSMWGSSYGGFNQWAAARLFPPHLTAIEPAAAIMPGEDFPMWRNISYPYIASWTAYTAGRTAHLAAFTDQAFWADIYSRAYKSGVPFSQLDTFAGFPSATFRKWASHPMQDAFWDSLSPTREQYARIDMPILTITGYWDGAQMGALAYYARHMAAASPSARAQHYLIIGPFDHSGTRFPAPNVGGLDIPPNGALNMFDLDIAWYDWTLRGGPKPAFLKDKVAYYIVGADEWRYAPSFAAMTRARETFWLDANGAKADSVAAAGTLAPRAPRAARSSTYVYDPADFSNASEAFFAGPWILDDSHVKALKGDGVVFETVPLTKATDFAGRPRLDLYAAIDTPDTDFRARLFEVRADGSSVFLSEDRIRARYRNSLRKAQFVTPGKIEHYVFDNFLVLGRRVAAGSRIRLVVEGLNTIQAERNFDTNGVIADETIKDARKATVTVYQGGAYPSALSLPLAR